jgi:hypothetical protein
VTELTGSAIPTEWSKVKDWLRLAETAIRKDHDSRHEAPTIPLD